ncbi:nitroreductase family protein [Desulfolucanica intricata]|uniref:nitroreductase family protein n=1 Tax=Desulfolucanica intricata TaxID=1285191 RepID=UPI000831FAF6|nr:nitroreductase family protein [Desulfolucanica intricata]
MSNNSVLQAIRERRSVRHFTGEMISDELIREVLEAGRWAPSGLNNQPWRFVIIKDPAVQDQLANCTKYSSIINNAPVSLCVFLDSNRIYNRDKDLQGVGACIQNMLLAAHALGLGAVWLGEILNQKEKVREILELSEHLELMAVICMGYPDKNIGNGNRLNLEKLIIKQI